MEHEALNRFETMLRRFFERIGGAIDFALRRGEHQRTDLTALIPQVERMLETRLREEAGRTIAPNLIELRYDYETYTRMGQKRREYLQKELRDSLYEYIYNRRYELLHPVQVKIGYDAFTRGMEVKLDFGEGVAAVMIKGEAGKQAEPATAVEPQARAEICLIEQGSRQEHRAGLVSGGEPLSVGRNIANAVVIRDPTISNFHAAFVLRTDGTLELADRASANGTAVNGVLLGSADRTIVRDGDRLRFGEVEAMLVVKCMSA